jgi:phosphopantetheinyl transferase
VCTRFVSGRDALALTAYVDGRLTPGEQRWLAGLRFSKRREEWLLGRLLAKKVVADAVRAAWARELASSEVEIGTLDSGAPVVVSRAASGRLPLAPDEPLPLTLSISHSHGAAFCAVSWSADPTVRAPRLGVDVELIASRPADLWRDFFTPDELRYCADARDWERDVRPTLVWSIKESALKAFGTGLSTDPRAVICLPALPAPTSDVIFRCADDWQPIAVRCGRPLVEPETLAAGRWQIREQFVLTAVAL